MLLPKHVQENILRNSGDNWTIIRPYMSYSPNRLDLGYYAKELWLYRVLKGRTILFTEDVAKKLDYINSWYGCRSWHCFIDRGI